MKRTTRWLASLVAACISFAGFMQGAQATLVTVPFKGQRQIQDLEAHGVRIIAVTREGVDVEAEGAALDYLRSRPYPVKTVTGPQGAPPPGAAVIDSRFTATSTARRYVR